MAYNCMLHRLQRGCMLRTGTWLGFAFGVASLVAGASGCGDDGDFVARDGGAAEKDAGSGRGGTGGKEGERAGTGGKQVVETCGLTNSCDEGWSCTETAK